jgi:hypothetical protein
MLEAGLCGITHIGRMIKVGNTYPTKNATKLYLDGLKHNVQLICETLFKNLLKYFLLQGCYVCYRTD